MKTKNVTTSHLRNTVKRSPLRLGFLFIPMVLVCFGLSPTVRAVDPPPDGGYSGFNTAEGHDALFSLTTGVGNTAVGWFSLWSNTDGGFNTGVGAGTLLFNMPGQFGGGTIIQPLARRRFYSTPPAKTTQLLERRP